MTSVWRVIVTPRAAADLADAHAWFHARNPRAATDWLTNLRETVLGLAVMPQAHPLAPESDAFDIEVRRALYRHGTPWSIYFTLDVATDTVHVLHIRHGSRSPWVGETD